MNRFLRRLSIIALSWISLFRTAQADIEIRYIDDELGDSATGVLPEYSPATQWSFGPTCFNCYDKQYINTSDVFGRSWHETLINQFSNKTTLSLSFTGTSISVFCILPNDLPSTFTTAAYQFALDGVNVPNSTFVHRPDSSSIILYNALVFSISELPNSHHILEVSPFLPDGPGPNSTSLLLFDYAQYIYEGTGTTTSSPSGYAIASSIAPTGPEPATSGLSAASLSAGGSFSASASLLNSLPVFPSLATNSAASPSISITYVSPSAAPDSTQQTNAAAIAGGTIGGLAVIVGILLAFWCSRRRRRPTTIRYPNEQVDQEMQQHPAGTHYEILDEADNQHSRAQHCGVVAHSEPLAIQGVASSKVFADFRRTLFAPGGAAVNDVPMPSARAGSTTSDVSPPNVHARQVSMLSTTTEGGRHGALGGIEIRIPSDELARLRAESSNVQILQAEIARLRAGPANGEEPPPAY